MARATPLPVSFGEIRHQNPVAPRLWDKELPPEMIEVCPAAQKHDAVSRHERLVSAERLLHSRNYALVFKRAVEDGWQIRDNALDRTTSECESGRGKRR